MKILKTLMIATMLIFAPAYAFSSDLGYMRISLIEGDVQIKTPEAGDWGRASINGPLAEGDQVWTPEASRVELQLNNGTYIRLDENSALQILSMDRNSSQFYLSQGYAYVFYKGQPGSVIQFDTPDSSTRAFNRATFRIDMSDRYTDVSVYKGYVETENNVGNTRINAGEMLSLGQSTNGEVAPMGTADEWEDWNNARNERIFATRNGSSRYLPAELRTYASDLDGSGRWVEVPDYGYCWTPTVSVGANWSPYRAGRWIWRNGDYVWVAFEPWGWAPYHYGRWTFTASFGWCWVPPVAGDVYWSPGYVGWVRTPDYVAWVPLAPGEKYYGRGNYGPHSVNITKVNINQVNVTNVYKNVYVNNSVTIVNRNTFNTAAPTIVNVNNTIIRQKIFAGNNISVGAPQIKPTRASFFASARSVPTAKLPPQPVREIMVRELKQSRPLVKAPDKSVMNRGARTMELPVTSVDRPRTPGREMPTLRRVQPTERGKTVIPAQSGAWGVRAKPQAPEKRQPEATAGSATRGDRPQFQPADRARPAAPTQTGQWGVRPRPQTPEQRQPEATAGTAPKGDRPQVRPADRARPAAPAQTGQWGARPQRQTPDKRQPEVSGSPAPKMVKPQFQPADRAKTGGVAQPAPRGEKPQLQSAKKEKPANERGPGPKDEKKPEKPGEGAQRGQ